MKLLFEELDYRRTRLGELVLRRRTEPSLGVEVYEVKLGDEFLMSSLFTEGEIALARHALTGLGRDRWTSSSAVLDLATPRAPCSCCAPLGLRSKRLRTHTRHWPGEGGPFSRRSRIASSPLASAAPTQSRTWWPAALSVARSTFFTCGSADRPRAREPKNSARKEPSASVCEIALPPSAGPDSVFLPPSGVGPSMWKQAGCPVIVTLPGVGFQPGHRPQRPSCGLLRSDETIGTE